MFLRTFVLFIFSKRTEGRNSVENFHRRYDKAASENKNFITIEDFLMLQKATTIFKHIFY